MNTRLQPSIGKPVKEKMLGWESPPLGTTPEEFTRFVNEDIEKFARIVKAAQVPMQ